MLQDIDLRELAELRGNGRDFVSVYFRTADGLDALKSRQRNLRAMLRDVPDEAEAFELSMQRIHDLIEQHPPDSESACVFACELLDFLRGHPLSMPVENEIHVGPAPYIRPLAELQDEYQTFAVVACDNDAARIYVVTNREAEVEERVRGGVKNAVRKGGWSQKRYSRRRDEQLKRYAADVAAALTGIVNRHQIERVVLIGSKETMAAIEDEVDEGLHQKIIGREPFDSRNGEEQMIDEAYQHYFASERAEEEHLWETIKNEYMKHGLAVAGPTHVLEAVKNGRVGTMLLIRDLQITGTQCRDCELLVHGTPQTCQVCGSRSVFPVDLIDMLSQQAELTSAETEFCDDIPGLSELGGVAALLRY
jgi:peptide subunit release factor 1 (eRF1)